MKKLIVLIMSVVAVLALAACGGGNGGNGQSTGSAGTADSAATIKVEMDIEYPDSSGVADVEDVIIEVPEGASVLDATNAYADSNACEIVMSDDSSSPYITSIGGVAATDNAGWVYEINGEMVMETADAYVLKAGDEVSWDFESWGE